jgi:hypothetical protein
VCRSIHLPLGHIASILSDAETPRRASQSATERAHAGKASLSGTGGGASPMVDAVSGTSELGATSRRKEAWKKMERGRR